MRKAIARWALVAVGIPLAAAGARRLSRAVESRRGPSRTSGLLRHSAEMLDKARRPARSSRFGRR